MEEIIEFFRGLFDTESWPARWNCGYWSDFHGWLIIVSELTIWVAYFLIPLIIINYLYKRKEKLAFPKIYFLFASFILLCGATHFFDAMMFWIPMYRFNAILRLATGIVSLFTVYHLVKILPQVFKQKTNKELEFEILKREEAEKKLAEANNNLQAFAYVASHDLQEPLRKIRTFSSILQEKNSGVFDEKSTELINKISQSSERMQNMTNGILTLATLTDKIEMKTVNIADVINTAIQDLEIKIEEKKASINVGALPLVMGNEDYLTQLFLNLIGNALKFTEKAPVINISGEEKNGRSYIYVADNGIGISEENTSKVFDTFKRLNSRSEYEGSGIGLAICKRIADVHHGDIYIKSKLGEGTTFIVELQTPNP